MDESKYTFKINDCFNRKPIAEKAILLLLDDMDISPMVIDGAWGSGKTIFCHQMMNLLATNKTHQLIYIDAFKADHTGEPLITVLSHLINLLSRSDKVKFKQKALPVLKQTLKVVGKAAVGHILKSDTDSIVADYDKEISQISSKSIDVLVDSVLQSQVDADKNMDALVRAIASIARKKPIVIFIDELDRCRPDFALSMLEVIKHVFSVDGVQFVLVTNTEHLRASINHTYGSVVDAQRYLNKFIGFSFSLPNRNSDSTTFNQTSLKHYSQLIKASDQLNDNLCTHNQLALVKQIIYVNKLSLREVATLVKTFEIYEIVTVTGGLISEDEYYSYNLLGILALALNCFKPKVADCILDNKANAEDLANFLGPQDIHDFDGDLPPNGRENPNINIETRLIGCIGPECETNNDNFTPKTQSGITYWNEQKSEMFSDNSKASGRGKNIQIMTECIETIRLAV